VCQFNRKVTKLHSQRFRGKICGTFLQRAVVLTMQRLQVLLHIDGVLMEDGGQQREGSEGDGRG
jgi:hypothetical protein